MKTKQMKWSDRPFMDFMNAVDALLQKRHGINWLDATDANMMASSQKAGETPEEHVEWIATKYDLDRIDKGAYS